MKFKDWLLILLTTIAVAISLYSVFFNVRAGIYYCGFIDFPGTARVVIADFVIAFGSLMAASCLIFFAVHTYGRRASNAARYTYEGYRAHREAKRAERQERKRKRLEEKLARMSRERES